MKTNQDKLRELAWTSYHPRKDGTHKQKQIELPIFPRSGNTDYILAFAMEKPEWQITIKERPVTPEQHLNAVQQFEQRSIDDLYNGTKSDETDFWESEV